MYCEYEFLVCDGFLEVGCFWFCGVVDEGVYVYGVVLCGDVDVGE